MTEQLLDLISQCRGCMRECKASYELATEYGEDPYKALLYMRTNEKEMSELLDKMSKLLITKTNEL